MKHVVHYDDKVSFLLKLSQVLIHSCRIIYNSTQNICRSKFIKSINVFNFLSIEKCFVRKILLSNDINSKKILFQMLHRN